MTDRFVVRSVVLFLGVATLIGLVGLIWLVDQGKATDAALLAVVAGPTGSALGALSALLVHTSVEPVVLQGAAQAVLPPQPVPNPAPVAPAAPKPPAAPTAAPQPASAAPLPAGPVQVVTP